MKSEIEQVLNLGGNDDFSHGGYLQVPILPTRRSRNLNRRTGIVQRQAERWRGRIVSSPRRPSAQSLSVRLTDRSPASCGQSMPICPMRSAFVAQNAGFR